MSCLSTKYSWSFEDVSLPSGISLANLIYESEMQKEQDKHFFKAVWLLPSATPSRKSSFNEHVFSGGCGVCIKSQSKKPTNIKLILDSLYIFCTFH